MSLMQKWGIFFVAVGALMLAVALFRMPFFMVVCWFALLGLCVWMASQAKNPRFPAYFVSLGGLMLLLMVPATFLITSWTGFGIFLFFVGGISLFVALAGVKGVLKTRRGSLMAKVDEAIAKKEAAEAQAGSLGARLAAMDDE